MSLNEMLIYSEQMTKPLITASSAIMPKGSTTKSFSVSDRLSDSSKCLSNSVNRIPLGRYQGKSWSEILDFDRILKQIRLSEKSLISDKECNASCHAHHNSSYKTASGNLPLHDKSRKPQIRQVQRLSGTDMHYYGIVPKQASLDVIVCNLCTGTYTKKGFNNHMLLQHPTVWANISNKVLLSSFDKGPHGNDSFHDGAKEDTVSVNADLLGSPSDLSAMLSNSSNASSSSTSTVSSAATYIPGAGFNSRQKSSSNTVTDSGKSIGSSRSRSKSKHHSSSAMSKRNMDESTSYPITSRKKSSKKHSNSTSKSSSRNYINPPDLISTSKDISPAKDANVVDKLVISNKKQTDKSRLSKTSISSSYTISATSPGSSYSLPSTPKVLLANLQDTTAVKQVPSLNSIAEYPYSLLQTNSNETNIKNCSTKSSVNTNDAELTTKRKHNKLTHSFAGYDNTQIMGNGKKNKLATTLTISNGTSRSQHLHPYKMPSKNIERNTEAFTADEKITNGNGSNEIEFTVMTTNPEAEHSSGNGEGQLLQNTPDDSAMLKHVLEEFNRLDSKVINEILNAEAELNFNQNNLNPDSSLANDNQLQQQTAMYLDQPASKRIRFDDACAMQQQITSTATSPDGSIAFTIYQPQQSQYIQYQNSDATNTIQMDAQYHTPIDSLQLQNLLYQQQAQQPQRQRQQHEPKQQLQNHLNATVYGGVIDDMSMLNVQQMPDVLMAPKNLLAIDSTDQLLVKCKQEDYNSLADGSQQYQIFNVPSLMNDVDNQTMTHIIERQYVLPEHDEEQFIYEISTNNPVTAMSQEHQQEVLAEFLNQAANSYEQNQMENNVQHMEYSTENFDMINDELLDCDFSLIDAINSNKHNNATATSSNSTNNLYSNALIKEENDHQQHALSKPRGDYHYNALFYAGLPRPMAVNSFGVVNLPQRVSTTFHKSVLNTRKSNNSLLSLGSTSLNGMITANSSSSSACLTHRFSAAKQLPNYFTALAAVNNGRVSAQGNEFSIGSITITNASPNVNQQQLVPNSVHFQQSKQQTIGYSSVEIACNWSNGANGIMPQPHAISRTRHKIGLSHANSGSAFVNMSSSNLRSKLFSRFGASNTNTNKASVAVIGPNNSKSIIVNNAFASNLDRNSKVIKRNIFHNKNPSRPIATNAHFTSKKFANIINKNLITNADLHFQISANRINHFYEHRRKLLNMSRHTTRDKRFIERTSRSLPLPQKLLRQQLTRNMPNCGKISTSSITSILSNDGMQVLV